MKISFSNLAIFLCSAVSLFISAKVFYIQAIFVDEHNLSMSDIFGGDIMLAMVWLRMFLLAVVCVLSICKILKRK